MKLKLPKKPVLLLLAACLGTVPVVAGASWYLGWSAYPSIAPVLPWIGSTGGDGGGAETATHPAGEAKSAEKLTLDKIALQKEVETQAQSLKELRLSLQELLDSQTALARGNADAEERYNRAKGAIADKIKTLNHRALSSQEAEQLAIYLFSGGDPSLVENLPHSLEKDSPNKALLEGAVAYVSRDLKLADSKLRGVDLTRLHAPVLSRVLLVQSQTTSSLDAAEKARLLAQAAGLSPGTLVEEASIRRLVQLWADVANAGQFMKWSRHYLRRFPKSYYRGDFVKSFAAGILKTARQGYHPRKDDIDFVLRSFGAPDAGRMALVVTKSSLDAGLKELCITVADTAVQILPKASPDRNTVMVHGLACKAADAPVMVLAELADSEVAGADATSLQVLQDAQILASSILQEDLSRVPRTPGETQEVDQQLENFTASVAQQLKSSFRLLQESKK